MVDFGFSLYTLEFYLVILVRISAFVMVAPFYGTTNVPVRMKAGFSFVVALLLYQVMIPQDALSYTGVIEFALIVVKEGITGLLIGFAANICNSIIMFSGKIIDMEIGLGMAQMFDPITNIMSGITGNLYNYFLLLLLFALNMHHYILKALIDSYTVVPVNEAVFDWEHLFQSMMTFIVDMAVIGFRIVLPIFVCALVLNCILGILAKVAPQMNMFSVGMQLKVLMGLGVMYITVIMMPSVANYIFTEMKKMIVLFIEGMY
jgi:flagellar biosynthetic protein FliR